MHSLAFFRRGRRWVILAVALLGVEGFIRAQTPLIPPPDSVDNTTAVVQTVVSPPASDIAPTPPAQLTPPSVPLPPQTATGGDYAAAPGSAVAPPLPGSSADNGTTLSPTYDRNGGAGGQPQNGYFPTQDDSPYFGDREYPRSRNLIFGGPDREAINANGIFPYQSDRPNFFDQHADFFKPIDRVLGFVTDRNQSLVIESQSLQDASLTLYAGLPGLFTRELDPDHAMFRLGPLYLDVLWLQAGALWSSYSGPQVWPKGEGPGWLVDLEMMVRGYLRITDEFYIVGAIDLIYLPIDNHFGFEGGLSNQIPQVVVEANYDRSWGEWDVRAFDRFWVTPGLDFNLYRVVGDPFEQAGRYYFGFEHVNINPAIGYENDAIGWNNTVQLEAGRLLMDNQWLLTLRASHSDAWQGSDFDNHGEFDHFTAFMAYEGSQLMFAPAVFYDFYGSSFTGSEYEVNQEIGLWLHGRLTENINGYVRAMYEWQSGFSPIVRNWGWDATINHRITSTTTQSITGGMGLQENTDYPEAVWADYIGYSIVQRICSDVSITGTFQWSRNQTFTTGTDNVELAGLGVDWRPFDYTHVALSAYYEHQNQQGYFPNINHWLYRASISQVLASRLTLELFYQYENYNTVSGFAEHAVGLSLRRYF